MVSHGCSAHLLQGWAVIIMCSVASGVALWRWFPFHGRPDKLCHCKHCPHNLSKVLGLIARLVSSACIATSLQLLLTSAGTCSQTWPTVNAAISCHAAIAEVFSWVMFGCLAKGLRGSRSTRDDLWCRIQKVPGSQGFLPVLQASGAFYGLCGLVCAAYFSVLHLSSLVTVACCGLWQIATGGCRQFVGQSCLVLACGSAGTCLLQRFLQRHFHDVYSDESRIVGQLLLKSCPRLLGQVFIAASMLVIVTHGSVACIETQPTVHLVLKWASWLLIASAVRLLAVFVYQLWHRTRVVGSIISSLPTVEWCENRVEESGECSICFENFAIGECTRQTPCGHFFHQECLEPWLARQQNCPTCRASLTAAHNHQA